MVSWLLHAAFSWLTAIYGRRETDIPLPPVETHCSKPLGRDHHYHFALGFGVSTGGEFVLHLWKTASPARR